MEISEFKGCETIGDEYSLLCIKFWIKLWYKYKMLVCESIEKKIRSLLQNINVFYKLSKTICFIYRIIVSGSGSNASMWENNEDV